MNTHTKIMILFALLFCFSAPLSAQVTDIGNFLVGGRLGFSTASSSVEVKGDNSNSSHKGTRSTQVNIAPSIGYFLANNFALGLGFEYTFNKLEQPVTINSEEQLKEREFDSDLLFGPFTRYYLPVGLDKAFFLEATFGLGNSVDEIEFQGGTQSTATSVYALGIGPGFTIFSQDAIGIEALIKYNWARTHTDFTIQGINTDVLSLTNQVDFSIGFQFYFTRVRPATTREEPLPGSTSFF